MSALDRILSGLKTIVTVADDMKSVKAEVKALDDRERELRDRIGYIEGLLAGAGAPPRDPRLSRR